MLTHTRVNRWRDARDPVRAGDLVGDRRDFVLAAWLTARYGNLSHPVAATSYGQPTMTALWNGFLLLLANATDRELARMIEFLKAENRILRSKLPGRIEVTPAERRRLLKLGQPLGTKVRQLLTIVSIRTFRRWLKAAEGGTATETRSSKGGRPRTPAENRDLVLRMAADNGWGFGRIVGELKKLGIAIGKTTVKDILRGHGYDLGPKRSEGTWAEFIERHAKTLWACDFFQKKIWTIGGLVDYFALFFIHVGSRRVILAGLTPNPTPAWVAQQARNVAMEMQDREQKPTHLIRDNDTKYSSQFDDVFETEGVEVVKTCIQAPNMNAFIERWIQSLQVECLDQCVVFGEDHLRHLIDSYQAFHNSDRPHQSRDNLPLDGHVLNPPADWQPDQLECTESLGGVLKSYSWKAAA